jgi:ABC-type hemin transport system ATPase subunit
MVANFRFSNLSINSFRGIRELDLDLPEGMPMYLVGGNNSGKSTLLNGFALALGGGGFHQFVPEPFDFFHSADGEPAAGFTATLHLAADDVVHLPAVQGVGNPEPVHTIEVRGVTDGGGRLSHRRLLLDRDGDPILYSPRTPLKGKVKQQYKGRRNLGWARFYARTDDIRDNLPELWLLTPHNLRRSLYEWKTGPLQRLSRLLAERFWETDWHYERGGKAHPMPQALIDAHDFFRGAVAEFPFWKEDLRPRLEAALSDYVGAQASFDLRPEVQAVQDWLTQQLAISFAADAGAASTPLDRMGDGWQSLIRLAALDVLSQYQGEVAESVVLLFEEPETHLHPHLRRRLRGVLARLAAQGWVVLCATHSPEIVSFADAQVIVRLWRKGEEIGKGVLNTTTAGNAVKLQEKLDERGNHEMLFANKVVLCEGKGDCWALSSGLHKVDPTFDLDARSISLVETGSAQNLPDYAEMASRLGIPWCALTDENSLPSGEINPKTERVRLKLKRSAGDQDTLLVWPGSLEACLNVLDQKATPQWQISNIDPKPLQQLEIDHPDYVATCRDVLGWLL